MMFVRTGRQWSDTDNGVPDYVYYRVKSVWFGDTIVQGLVRFSKGRTAWPF